MLQTRVPHRLIKGRQEGLREVVVLRETYFNRGINCPEGTLSTVPKTAKREEACELFPLGAPHELIKGWHNKVD